MSRAPRHVKPTVTNQRRASGHHGMANSGGLGGDRRFGADPRHSGYSNNQEADRLVSVLSDKVHKQREEIDGRVDNINMLQRNFERLSGILSGEKEEINVLRAKLAEAQKEIDDLKAQIKLNNVIRAEFERISQEYTEYKTGMEDQYAAAMAKVTELEAQTDEMQEEIFRMESEHVLELQDKERDAVTMSALSDQREQLIQTIKDLQAKWMHTEAQLAKQNEALKVATGDLAMKESALADLQQEVDNYARDLKKAHEDLTNLASNQNQTASAEVTTMRQQLKDMEQAWKLDKEAMESLKAGNTSLHDELAALKVQLEAQIEANKALSEDLVMAKGANSSWDDERTQLEKEIQTLKESDAEKERDLRDKDLEAAKVQNMLQNEMKETARLQKLLGELQSQSSSSVQQQLAEKRKMEGKIGLLEGEVQHLLKLMKEKDRSHEFVVKEKDDILNQMKGMTTDEEALKASLIKLQNEFESFKAASEEELDALRVLVREKETQLSRLHEELEAMASERDSLDESLQRVISERDAAWSKIDGLKGTEAQLQSKEMGMKELADANDELKKKCQGLEDQVSSLRKDLATSEQRCRELERSLQTLQTELNTTKKLVESKECEIQCLKEENEKLKAEKAEKETRVETALGRLKTLQGRTQTCIKKLIQNEEATESLYTCLHCLEIYKKPITCVPCGHTFCNACVDQTRGDSDLIHCKECDQECVDQVIDSEALDLLSGKFVYRKQVLQDLLAELVKI